MLRYKEVNRAPVASLGTSLGGHRVQIGGECAWWRIWAWQGRRAPPLGINYLSCVRSPLERAHPGYYCLIDGQTNGSRPPSNNVVIKLSAGADRSVTAADDPATLLFRGSHRLRTSARTLSHVLPPPFVLYSLLSSFLSSSALLSLSLSLSGLHVTDIKAMSRLHARPAILYALMSAHVVAARCPNRRPRLQHADIIRYACGQSKRPAVTPRATRANRL